MASIKSQRFSAPKLSHGDGRAVFIVDKISLTANPTAADTLDFKIPKGLEVTTVEIQCDDLDTNGTPTIVFGVGYAPIDSPSAYSASATYFAAAGQTTAQGGGRLRCAFKPITFQEDVMLRLTVATASATFAAGDVIAILGGTAVGVSGQAT